jgi:L-seryl-tRNA(Ser) seleniumtransferase
VEDGRRGLPAVHRLLDDARIARYVALFGTGIVKRHCAAELDRARAAVAAGTAVDSERLVDAILIRLGREDSAGLLPVLNGTGIVLHTNLGRAPLADEALRAMSAIAGGYSNLEFDLDDGVRGSRYARVSALLRETTGADDGIVVNNCAAAMLLILDTFAKGREVVVSRNQLIEIGGGFRLPDVLRRSGATLVEVGATNKVALADFTAALGADTALLLRSHTSNYRITGFTADVAAADLAALGKRAGIPVVEDLGSGVLVDIERWGLPHERTVREAIADGVDLVAFSGDKLLGGPQAGIIAGRSAAIARLRTNPLLRALRVDKATLAALAATLRLYLEPADVERIPFFAMIAASEATLRARAHALVQALPDRAIAIVASAGFAGGGSLPMHEIPSIALALAPAFGDANAYAARLRAARPPLVGRALGDRVLIDLRTIPPQRDADLIAVVRATP